VSWAAKKPALPRFKPEFVAPLESSQPGGAFGPDGDGHLRLCFARDPEQIAKATRRMARWLGA
jgi:hypothetical protein